MANENDDREDDNEPGGTEPGGTEERLTIPIGDDDSDDDPGDGGEEGDAETRAAKKRNRQRLRDEAEELRRQNTQLTDRLTRSEQLQQDLQRQIADTRQRVDDAGRRGDDPLETELKGVRRQLQQLADHATALGEKATQKQIEELQTRAEELRDRELELVAERVTRRNQPRQDPAADTKRALAAMYPEVYAKPEALRWANGRMHQLAAEKGEPRTQAEALAMARQAMDDAKKQYRLGQPPPSENERRKFNGVPRGGTGGGPQKVTDVDMSNPVHQKMANAAYPHIKDKKERYKKWAQGAGKRLVEKKVIRGR